MVCRTRRLEGGSHMRTTSAYSLTIVKMNLRAVPS